MGSGWGDWISVTTDPRDFRFTRWGNWELGEHATDRILQHQNN